MGTFYLSPSTIAALFEPRSHGGPQHRGAPTPPQHCKVETGKHVCVALPAVSGPAAQAVDMDKRDAPEEVVAALVVLSKHVTGDITAGRGGRNNRCVDGAEAFSCDDGYQW